MKQITREIQGYWILMKLLMSNKKLAVEQRLKEISMSANNVTRLLQTLLILPDIFKESSMSDQNIVFHTDYRVA